MSVQVAMIVGYIALRTVGLEAFQFVLGKMPFVRHRKIYPREPQPKQLRGEMISNVTFILLEALFWSTVLNFHLLGENGSQIILSFLVSAIWWDVSYYVLHRSLHHKKLFFLHRHHHVAKINTAVSGNSFSLIEGSLTILVGWGPLIAVGHYFPLSYLGMFLFSEVLCAFRVLGHSNYEFYPTWFVRSKFTGLMQTPSFHAMHHARFSGHYGLLTTVMDRLFKTDFVDYEAVHSSAFLSLNVSAQAKFVDKPTADAHLSDVLRRHVN